MRILVAVLALALLQVPEAERLAEKRNYREFLRTLGRTVDALPWVVAEGGTHGERDWGALERAVLGALDRAEDPMARQHLVFLAAVALPDGAALPRLRALRAEGRAGDAEDALCALAFRGDPEAIREFRALAAQRAPVDARRLVDVACHDRLDAEGERELLRAWRCIEVLEGQPYFRLHDRMGAGAAFRYGPTDPETTAYELLPSWLARYEGHPGSDDMSLRLSRMAWHRGAFEEALRWAARAATVPDGDVAGGAVALLAAEAESVPLGTFLSLLPDPDDPEPLRELLHSVRLRRLAAEEGFDAALADAERLALREPDLGLSRAFRARWGEASPRGLDSGLRPLPQEDPLRRVSGEAPPPGRAAFQFRCWETLAELLRRAGAPATGAEQGDRLDALYKAGAVLFHERDSLYPLHAPWEIHRSGRPWPVAALPIRDPGRDAAWCRGNLPRLRAAELFGRVVDADRGGPLADRAAYSLGLSLLLAAREPPLLDGRHLAVDLEEPRRLLGEGVLAMERCAREHPGSPLAADAAALAARWRERLARRRDE